MTSLSSIIVRILRVEVVSASSLKYCLWIPLLLSLLSYHESFSPLHQMEKEKIERMMVSSCFLGIYSAQNVSLRDEPITMYQFSRQRSPARAIAWWGTSIGANNQVLNRSFFRG